MSRPTKFCAMLLAGKLPMLRLLQRMVLAILGAWSGQAVLGDEGREVVLMREQAKQLHSDGNLREALALFRELTLDALRTDDRAIAYDVRLAGECMQQLGEVDEADAYLDSVAKRHVQHWRVQGALGRLWLQLPHEGYTIGGQFRRGPHRGEGELANSAERDRVLAMQCLRLGMELVPEGERASPEAEELLNDLLAATITDRQGEFAWRLQQRTDLAALPEIEAGWPQWRGSAGAPVDARRDPILYTDASDWNAAENDGQRWRFILTERSRWRPSQKAREFLDRAQFQNSQFGVETLASFGGPVFDADGDDAKGATGVFALHTLGDDETIAKLATGVRRFQLAPDYHPIALLLRAVEAAPRDGIERQEALTQLATTFENRRQYVRAAEYWHRLVDEHPEQPDYLRRWEQIVKPWGRLEPASVQPEGRGATIDLRHRNAERVEFLARSIRVKKLLEDVKAYLTSGPKDLDWERVQIDNLGYRLVVQNQVEYLGDETAAWHLDLRSSEGHYDRRTTVATPLQKAGAYLVTAKIEGGNEHHIVLWVADTAIVKKNMPNKALYYAADALTGKPLENLTLELFGFHQQHIDGNRFHLSTQRLDKTTDANGLAETGVTDAMRGSQWMAIATDEQGRFGYLGYSGFWGGEGGRPSYRQVKSYAITDRPVYRPSQKVHYKFWVCNAQYDIQDQSQFAHQAFQVEIRDPRNEKVYSQVATADAYGGISGAWELTPDASLGLYQIHVVNHGGGVFRVEEYKKPEFEVKVDAPQTPVASGETFRAVIRADYYFGSPVAEGVVRYKVYRTAETERWFPPRPWDWLYGPGYGLLHKEYPWYPQWERWGCAHPSPWWIGWGRQPPELVASEEVPLGADGTIEVVVDTAIAKQLYPDEDQRYRIEAEVIDASRRTVVADGSLLASRAPARVHVAVDRGHYRTGDAMQVQIDARTPNGAPLAGKGTLRLMRIAYRDAQPMETLAAEWDLPTGSDGTAELRITAAEPGQFRVAYELSIDAPADPESRQTVHVEGGQIFTVRGPDFDGRPFRFNAIELIADRREYAVGDKVSLQVNVDRADAAVVLFVRPENGTYDLPQIVRMNGKSSIVELDVRPGDAPNFFVEGVTVHGGKCHTDVCEIFVPPASRILQVEVASSAQAYLPGTEAEILLKVRDADGRPFVGSTVVAVYDKALDAIAGDSVSPDIREFFWKWRRQHASHSETNLDRSEWPLGKPNFAQMESLGLFGESVADEKAGQRGEGLAFSKSRAMVPMAAAMSSDAMVAEVSAGAPPSAGDLSVPRIRQEFADTALWVAALETNSKGIAAARCRMPDNLTAWRVRVWAMGQGTRVGQGSTEIVTRKNLIVRLQTPRFVVDRDEVTLSANVHNYLSSAKETRVRLDWPNSRLAFVASETGASAGEEMLAERTIKIPAGGEVRIDWRVRVRGDGPLALKASALTDEESDAMQVEVPALVHGMAKTESFSGTLRPSDEHGGFQAIVPEARRPEASRLEVRYSPTLAGALVDAIPYLIDYPHGCTEQTLNRFLPAVIAQRTLQRMQIDLSKIREKRTNLNSQQIGATSDQVEQQQRFGRNPVFSEEELGRVVRRGVGRLQEMQLSDGGWGWFSGWGEKSSPHTTAVVVHGLSMAKQNDVALVAGMLEKGVAWLVQYQRQELAALDNWDREGKKGRNEQKPFKPYADELDALILMTLSEQSHFEPRMRDYLYQDRTQLAPYALATLGLALHREATVASPTGLDVSMRERLVAMRTMAMRNLSQFLQQDDENQTAWLDMPADALWHWYGSEFEAQAYYLKLMSAVEPSHPAASRLVKYLLNNRQFASRWNSTRDTALVVEALADYLQSSGEDRPQMQVQTLVDGKVVKEATISPDNLFSFDNAVVLHGTALATGNHVVEFRKQGAGPLYYSGYLTNFTLEDPILASGLELKVARRYFKLSPKKEASADVAGGRGEPIRQRTEQWERIALVDGMEVTSGDLVEVELLVASKNDYEYIVLEDPKPAGFEPVDQRSGYNGNALGAYVEYRDQNVALFVQRLARGEHSVAYRMRAEAPGRFSALPTRASAMYAPELRGNAAEFKAVVVDRAD